MRAPYTSWFIYFFVGIPALAALGIGIYLLIYTSGFPMFKGVSLIESGLGDDDILLASCDNKTIGVEMRTFTGTTVIAYGCPETRNQCSQMICTAERKCKELKLANVTCSEDFDCDDDQRCDTSTCGCVSTATSCTNDQQCINLNMTNPCEEAFCDLSGEEGRCTTRFRTDINATCSIASSCPGLQICQECMCIDPGDTNSTLTCITDENCIDFAPVSDCKESFCNITASPARCSTRFIDPMFDCDGSCDTGEVCENCVCTPLPAVETECISDDQCLDFGPTSMCVEAFCNTTLVPSRCQTRYTVMGGDCSSNSDCETPGETCNGCICSVPEACAATGYDIGLVSPPDGFTCGLDVGIDDNVIISVCYLTDEVMENVISLISWVKTGSTWIQADLVNTTIFLQSSYFPSQPAMDMDDGRLMLYGNSNINPASDDKHIEFWDYAQDGTFTFNTLITPITAATISYVPFASPTVFGSVCIAGDFAILADAVIGDGSANSTASLEGVPWFFFDGVQWSATFPTRIITFNQVYLSLTSCQLRRDGFGIVNFATPGIESDPFYNQFEQYYRFVQIVDPSLAISNQDVYRISQPPNGNRLNPIFEGVIVEPRFGEISFNPNTPTVFGSFILNGIVEPDRTISPFLLPTNYNQELDITWIGQSMGYLFPGVRDLMHTFGSNILFGNVIYRNFNVIDGTIIEVAETVQMAVFPDPVFVSLGLYEDQPVWGVKNGTVNGFFNEYVILANTCP